MKGQMSKGARKELVAAVTVHYMGASKQEKSTILDEFVRVTGYHRKHALRVLKRCGTDIKTGVKSNKARIYDQAVEQALLILWEAADRMCGKRLKAAIPGLIESMERHHHLNLTNVIREKILRMSAATIDRKLAPARKLRISSGRRKKNGVIKRQVPVRTFADWDGEPPGYFEADFVVHSGGSMRGSPVHSLVLTDVYSGWTEAVPLVVREQSLVVEALRILQQQLPIPLRGFDTDNDGAFLNDTLLQYCKKYGIVQTRSRPYHKNDQAWIEQKNGSVVRRLVGYDRFEGIAPTGVLARLYGASRLYVNFFQPTFKLKEKVRYGSRIRKNYFPPATPCDRLLCHPSVDPKTKMALRHQLARLDPVALLHKMRECQKILAQMAGRFTPTQAQVTDVKEFMRGLSTLWQSGEQRPTHRQKPHHERHWRTRKDPFAPVWPEAELWLAQNPEGTGKQLFEILNAAHQWRFPPGQLRTLQRRLKKWRAQKARSLILPGEPEGVVDEWMTGMVA